MHQRQLIRESIRNLLLDNTKVGKRVYTNRASLANAEEMPLIVIFNRSESADEFNQAPRELKKTIDVVIEIMAIGQEQATPGETELCGPFVEDILDDIAFEVERELARDDTLQCTATKSIMTATEFDFKPEGSEPIGSARLVYAVDYYEHSPRSRDEQHQINEKELKSIKSDWDFADPDGIIEATDEFDVE